ncbi:MAG: cytochrome C551 [Synechococcus sp. MED-G69]|nr:MAG: cytochrome C551 [Synechococcus sp. MED-G69]
MVYINPVEPQDGFVIDGLRHQIGQRCSSALGRPVRSEVILTVNPPIHHLDPTPQAAP